MDAVITTLLVYGQVYVHQKHFGYAFATPIGQLIPFGPIPQYPKGFLSRYC
jgi:hypothetical protein